MSSYESKSPPSSPKKTVEKKPKRESVKMSDSQKEDLKKHMEKVGKKSWIIWSICNRIFQNEQYKYFTRR